MSRESARGREVELFKKASYLFNKNGYASTSIRQICRAIGIREGSIYHYIEKKEDILYKICEWSMLQSLEVIDPIVQSNMPPDRKLKEMIETHIKSIAQNSNEHSTMLKELRALSPGNQRKIVKLRKKYEDLFSEVIADCVEQGFFRKLNVKLVTLALLGMMNWLIHWYSSTGRLESKQIAQFFSDLFIRGPAAGVFKNRGPGREK